MIAVPLPQFLPYPPQVLPQKIQAPVSEPVQSVSISKPLDYVYSVPKKISTSKPVAVATQKAADMVAPLVTAGVQAVPAIASLFGGGTAKSSPSSAQGESGDINQQVSFGDFIINGSKFSPVQIGLIAAASILAGGLLLRLFKKRGKK